MNKIIIVLCAALAVAKGYDTELAEKGNNIQGYIDTYLNHYRDVLDNYNEQLSKFYERHSGHVVVTNQQRELLSKKINRVRETVRPWEVMGRSAKTCVDKYLYSIESLTASNVARSLNECTMESSVHLNNTLKDAIEIKQKLEEKFANFENDIVSCNNDVDLIIRVTEDYTKYKIENGKEFEYALDTAKCNIETIYKKLHNCHFSVTSRSIGTLSRSDLLFNECISGKSECLPCPEDTCSDKLDVHLDRQSMTMPNPFLGNNYTRGCLMLNVLS